MRGPRADRVPRIVAEYPIAEPSRLQAFDVGFGRDGRLEQRTYGHAARVLAQLLLENVAGGAADERIAHRRVMSRMLAWSEVDEASARDRDRRAGHSEHEPVVDRGRDRSVQVQLDPAFGAGFDLVPVEHDDAAAHLRRPRVQLELGSVTDGVGRGGDDTQPGVDASRRL